MFRTLLSCVNPIFCVDSLYILLAQFLSRVEALHGCCVYMFTNLSSPVHTLQVLTLIIPTGNSQFFVTFLSSVLFPCQVIQLELNVQDSFNI